MDSRPAAIRQRRKSCRCVYCGATVKARHEHPQPVTCALHRDLPGRDPFYADVVVDQWKDARK